MVIGPPPSRGRPRGSIASAAGGPREGDHVADIRQTGYVGNRSLEAQAKARVRHRAVASEIAIPAVGVRVEAGFRDAAVEDIEPLLALAAADDLADTRGEHVHRGDRPA